MPTLYAVIMAGGRGERFWPLSARKFPKPFIPLLGGTSLLQDTVARIQPLVPPERICVSIGAEHLDIARRQLPELPEGNFLVEPVGRDTSACVGFCALHLERRDGDAVMLALPADHYIADGAAYRETVQTGLDNLEGASGVVFGIAPTRPETGYGYILAEKPPGVARADGAGDGAAAWPVTRFVEKPDAATAARYVADGGYYWNSGMFLWRNRTLLDLFARFMPETAAGLDRLRPLIAGTALAAVREEVAAIFSALPRISIDFGIMEKAEGLRLVPARFGWDDIGSWASLGRALAPDAAGNIVQGAVTALDTRDCVIYCQSGRSAQAGVQSGMIATYGVSDLVIVQAYGKVLVCSRDKAADLKKLVAALPEEPWPPERQEPPRRSKEAK
ncbi:MAG: NTP transferase domain-containing protein [Acidobacteriota bacterium]|jgi:mannose-1-phosphate guanylyltransferase|nr:NTP transferase domain-containing protein [Acidobacteriota bacterium]